jgi:hypothetical protein
MSVPLDRLYNYLYDIVNHDNVVIYGFFPYGSRKISDLVQLANKTGKRSGQNYPQAEALISFVPAFCHDQEPLCFDLYSTIDSVDGRYTSAEQGIADELIQMYRNLVSRVIDRLNFKLVLGVRWWKYPVILVHSEKRSNNLIKYEKINYVGVYWWAHALIALDWFRYAAMDPMLNKRAPTCDFLIYNRAWSGVREYRIKFAELLVRYQLVDQCRTWFSERDECHYTEHEFKNTKFSIENIQLEKYFQSSTSNSTASADYYTDDYVSTQIEVVLETLFDDERLHLTEKSLRPIACGQPFILAATHGSLEYLQSYGFETFNGLIDETYDTITDPLERLHCICKEMKRINTLPSQEKLQLFAELRTIAERNKKLFFSQDWQQKIINEYQTNFETAYSYVAPRIKLL